MRRTILGLSLLVLGLSLPSVSDAGKCDYLVNKARSVEGAAAVSTYKQLLKCSKDEAQTAFPDFMKAAKEVGHIVELSLAAIDQQSYVAVWNMMEKIPDYEARDEIAKGVGAHCTDHPEVIPFLKGAKLGLRDLQFSQWDDALITCGSPDLLKWLESEVSAPPSSKYDEKYNTILSAYVKRSGAAALPVLQKAATAAAENGPFNTILEKMDQAVQPSEIGASVSEKDKKALEEALVAVAKGAGPEQARFVADRLYNAGAESVAAGLLPQIYSDRVQSGGSLLYGVAAIEACEGDAIIHWASVTEPAKRWSILDDVEPMIRGVKPKLKCSPDGAWPVLITTEPMASAADISAWVAEIESDWSSKDFSVKLRAEKDLTLD